MEERKREGDEGTGRGNRGMKEEQKVNTRDEGLTFVAASTLAPSLISSATTSTWPSLAARCRAFSPFCEARQKQSARQT